MRILYIIRGLPGAGKTTLAHMLTPHRVAEADQFFTNSLGEYNYSQKRLSDAHAYCAEKVLTLMRDGSDGDISVANTFSRHWEYIRYVEMADNSAYTPVIITVKGPWKSIHNVPDEVIRKMAARWEH